MNDSRVLPNLQACRALAALFVVYGHSLHDLETISTRAGLEPLRETVNWGVGVDIFFVISGFIMVHVAAADFGVAGGSRRFLVKRLARVAPMYWLFTTALILGALVAPGLLNVPIGGLGHILASYAFVPDWRPDHSAVRPVMALGWTLNYEMLFYVVFAAAMLAPLRIAVAAMSALFLAAAAAHELLGVTQTQIAFWTDPICLEFVFGVYLGLAYRSGMRLSAPSAATLGAIALVLLVSTAPEHIGLSGWPNALRTGLPATMLIAAATLGPDLARGAPTRLLVALGDASYALYLCHPFVIRPLRELWTKVGAAQAPLPLFSLACLLGSAALALALHYGVERQIARALAPLVRRLGGPREKPAPAALTLIAGRSEKAAPLRRQALRARAGANG